MISNYIGKNHLITSDSNENPDDSTRIRASIVCKFSGAIFRNDLYLRFEFSSRFNPFKILQHALRVLVEASYSAEFHR